MKDIFNPTKEEVLKDYHLQLKLVDDIDGEEFEEELFDAWFGLRCAVLHNIWEAEKMEERKPSRKELGEG